VLSEEHGFRVDSRTGMVTKDMVIGRDTTSALRLSRPDIRAIEDKCRKWQLMRVREPHPRFVGPTGSQDPAFWWTLEVWMDGAHRRFLWSTGAIPTETAEWHALFAVKNKILNLVLNRPEYLALPFPRGGYL